MRVAYFNIYCNKIRDFKVEFNNLGQNNIDALVATCISIKLQIFKLLAANNQKKKAFVSKKIYGTILKVHIQLVIKYNNNYSIHCTINKLDNMYLNENKNVKNCFHAFLSSHKSLLRHRT